MPRVMKKEMPGGGHVDYGMGGKMDYGMGGKMEMGHGGDMARAIKIYLMKKGGKTLLGSFIETGFCGSSTGSYVFRISLILSKAPRNFVISPNVSVIAPTLTPTIKE